MDLERDDARFRSFSAVIHDVGSTTAIDEMLNMIAIRDDQVVVPLFIMNIGLQGSAIGESAQDLDLGSIVLVHDMGAEAAFGENTPPSFLIENSAVGLAGLEISLITADDKLFDIDEGGTVLDPRIPVENAVAESQFKVVDHAVGPDEEGVVFERIFGGGISGEVAILDLPMVGQARPTGEIFAVEENLSTDVGTGLGAGGEFTTSDRHRGETSRGGDEESDNTGMHVA